MKIEIRRKLANGLVIGLQVGAGLSVAHGSVGDVPRPGLERFVAQPAPTAISASEDPLQLALADGKKPADDDPSGGAVGLPGPKVTDPSGGAFPQPTLPTPPDERSLTREQNKEPPDDG